MGKEGEEQDQFASLLDGVDLSGLSELADERFDEGLIWSVKPDFLNSPGRFRRYSISHGLVGIDFFVSSSSIVFGWDSDVKDVLAPGDSSNYFDFMDLILEQLPLRIDTEMRKGDELKASFGSHTKVELEYEDRTSKKYSLGNPIESRQFKIDYVIRGDQVDNVLVMGKDRNEAGDYRYILHLAELDTHSPRMTLILPRETKRWGERAVSLPQVLEWVLATHKERRRIINPRAEGFHVGGLVYDILTADQPPRTTF